MPVAAPEALLTSKLGIRVRGTRHVERERLRAFLERARDARLVLVSAPAGFGKSTLLADWFAAPDVRSAWLSLDRGDNDVVRFARGLAAAAAQVSGGAPGVAVADAGGSFDPELALARVLEHLAVRRDAAGSGRSVLVLDDYHLVDEPAVHRLVASLIERLPAHASLAIGTRADPPLPLARLRARGELVELRAGDLRFTPSEADALLRASGVELAEREVETLTGRTEGWAAALRLAAVSLHGRPNQAELVERFGGSHRFIFDYVIEEVLAGLAPETQDFLLYTSILDRLCGPLCDAVTGRSDGQERLEELERANLLIVPLDDERRWYRYHALFAEILHARLAVLHRDEVAALHARASAWHEERRDDDEAIHHALRSGDVERMSRVVAYASGRHVNAGELSTVRGWLDALPADVVRHHAQLAAAYAWYFVLVGDNSNAAEWLAIADRAFADGHDGGPAMRPGIPTQLAMLRSQLAGLEGDSATAIEQARLALEIVPRGLDAQSEATLRGTACVLLAVALLRAGDLEAAAATYEAGLPDLRAGGNVFATGRSIADLARIAITQGDPERALRLCEAELARDNDDASAAGTGAVWAALARAHEELGQVDLADAAARRAIELASWAGDGPVAHSAHATLDRIASGRSSVPAGDRVTTSRSAEHVLVEALTERELEVLRLVALGRSNSQIAFALFVTVGTVKSHLHTIAGKLGASNRVESVARGRELGLLA